MVTNLVAIVKFTYLDYGNIILGDPENDIAQSQTIHLFALLFHEHIMIHGLLLQIRIFKTRTNLSSYLYTVRVLDQVPFF